MRSEDLVYNIAAAHLMKEAADSRPGWAQTAADYGLPAMGAGLLGGIGGTIGGGLAGPPGMWLGGTLGAAAGGYLGNREAGFQAAEAGRAPKTSVTPVTPEVPATKGIPGAVQGIQKQVAPFKALSKLKPGSGLPWQ